MAKDVSAAPTPSFVTAEQNDCSNSLHSISITHQLTTRVSQTMSQVPFTGDHSTVSAEQFPNAVGQCTVTNDQPPTTKPIRDENSSVEVFTPEPDICSKVPMNEDIDTNHHNLER